MKTNRWGVDAESRFRRKNAANKGFLSTLPAAFRPNRQSMLQVEQTRDQTR